MRPRALLNVTAICLLLAAATVWAPPPPREPPPAAAAKNPEPWKRPEPWKKEATSEKAAVAAHPQLVLLQKLSGHSAGFRVVEGTVKRFSQDFEAGARNPERFLSEVRLSQPELLSEWQNTPREKRIFVIGAGKDSAKVSELAESLKSDGYAMFFYEFCRPLCSSKAVGAMFGTSGETMLYPTSFAKLSEYVTVEAATARFLQGLDKQVVLISTIELLAGKFAMHMAEMPTPTPSPVK